MGVYTIQPMGALPEGRTMIVWRDFNNPIFDSPDATCLRMYDELTLYCRAAAIAAFDPDNIIIRLPYQKWAYRISTGGRAVRSRVYKQSPFSMIG